MQYRIVLAVATRWTPSYNGGVMAAAEVTLNEDGRAVEECELDAAQLQEFARRSRAPRRLHSFGEVAPRLLAKAPWELSPNVWGECVRSVVATLMRDAGVQNPAPTLAEAAAFLGLPAAGVSILDEARLTAAVYAEAMRRRNAGDIQDEVRMLMDDGM